MGHLRTFALVAALLPVLTASSQAISVVNERGEAMSCATLTGRHIGGAVIENATWQTQDIKPQRYCRVVGVITPTSDSHIGFEVWLPPLLFWNGNFRGEGSGGSAGAISPGPMRDALAMGYATMSTDNGHVDGANGQYGLSWAYKHPEKMVDWAWRALHLSTVAAKDVVRAYYGKPAAKNYFISCSAGSHHAIMEATRFPADYDAMLGGAAPWKWTALMFGHTWNSMPAMKDPSALTPESVVILHRGMIKACDKLDGLEDGIIADPRRCTTDPVQFACSDTQKSECLTQVQVAAARHIYAGAKKSDGTVLMPGQVRGSELGWFAQSGGATPGGSSWDFWRQAVFQDPEFRNVNFDFDKDTERALATRVAGRSLGEVYDQTPNLDRFKARGGKFIFFQGWADSVITPMADVDFYTRIVARYGQKATDDFFRFFPLAGMGHCGGGIGFSHIGGATGAPLKDDADHDMVRALERWATKDEAPSLFIAARINDKKEVTATRPICRYPLEAQYLGRGETREAANFVCRVPQGL